MNSTLKPATVREFDHHNLPLSAETFAKIDAAPADPPSVISRETSGNEVAAEKLARGIRANDLWGSASLANA